MSTVNLVAIFEAKPEAADDVRTALSPVISATRAEEGCVNYTISESQASPGSFIVVETWNSQEDLNRHARAPHMKAAIEAIGSHLAAKPVIHPLRAIDV
ncbi:putative quinol monooxygenase [Rhodococcus sp. NPDC057014]|uniref:putative quinol monooxygenase n=1 Tax=Rhodococcus sp. NPDC057014 TaxID=3346000 RepID=UPI003632CCF3